ncbi:1596_t:CDS:2 [Racocetra persica]|uniref:1596_t:CDS:1 n=1 Tax=Racocetra persica TaxID=160502 RepID=A0ACA9KZR1_9GLOM|nr:1596_t:CDS:2 [Racocetra persica]
MAITTSKPINTKLIIEQLKNYQGSQNISVDIPNELTIKTEQGETSPLINNSAGSIRHPKRQLSLGSQSQNNQGESKFVKEETELREVQDYIDQNYPKAQRARVQKLDLRNLDLEGDLDLKDFTHYCFKVIVVGNPRLGGIKNKSEWYTAIVNKIYSTTQEWLEQEYSQKEQTNEIILSGIEFEQPSELLISDYPNVKEIKTEGYCQNEIYNITKVTINNCPQLEEVCIPNFSNQFLSLHHLPSLKKFRCGYGQLTGCLDLTPFTNLESVHCFGNQLTEIKLPAEKLEELAASGSNQLVGSLKHLKSLTKLNFLTICDTDIDSGLEYLSEELTTGINSNPELVNNAKQIKELGVLSNNLQLAFTNHTNTNKKCFQKSGTKSTSTNVGEKEVNHINHSEQLATEQTEREYLNSLSTLMPQQKS